MGDKLEVTYPTTVPSGTFSFKTFSNCVPSITFLISKNAYGPNQLIRADVQGQVNDCGTGSLGQINNCGTDRLGQIPLILLNTIGSGLHQCQHKLTVIHQCYPFS